MRSFAHCSSSASTLPSSVEAKPHCGDRHNCSSATYLVASSMRRLMSSLGSSRPLLRGDQAEHQLLLALGEIAQRLEAAGAVAVVLQEVAVEIGVAEQLLGDEFVAARGDEGGAEIAAAGMHGDRHVGGLVLQRRVGHLRVDRRQLVGVVAARFAIRPVRADRRSSPRRCRRVADSGSRRRRRRGSPCAKRRRHRRRIRRDRDRPPCSPSPGPCRKWNVDGAGMHIFGVTLQCALEKLEMLDLRVAGEIDLAGDLDRLGFGVDAVKLDRRRADPLDALQAPEKIEMPPGAAELAVGSELEADLLLLLDDLFDFAGLRPFSAPRRRSRPWRAWRAPPSAARCAKCCRHDRRETAAWCVGSLVFHSRIFCRPGRARSPAIREEPQCLPKRASPAHGATRRLAGMTETYLPQTSSANSTTMRSLAHCSSSASTLPSSVEAKPHCGDRQS